MYDYIIIGSGPSGGLLAHNLYKAGAKCLLMEAGKFFRKDTFPRNEADFSAQLYWGGGMEFDEKSKMVFLRAKVMGGTSIVNQALLNRFDEIAFNDWKTESGVDFFELEKMNSWYDKVENSLKVNTFAKEELNSNAKVFTSACDSLSYRWKYLRRAQDDCALEKGNDCLACLGGCHRDSKQSSLVAFIQKAEAEGLEIVSEFFADTIENKNGSIIVNGIKNGQKKSFISKRLILAAGAFGTTGILLKSGFGKQLPSLGKKFSSHPQFMSFGFFDEFIDSHKNAFQTVASDDPNFRNKGFKLENVFAPPIAIAMLMNKGGTEHHRMMKRYRNMACIEVAVRDQNSGEIKISNNGKLIVKKELTEQDLVSRDAGLQTVKNIFSQGGAKEIYQSPFYFGLHLMGGCSIGVNEKNSVVAPNFQLHGNPNIYIADSSIFPNAPGINPSLTIFALSHKLSEELIR